MAKYEDYVKQVQTAESGLEGEINDASSQQAARQDDATPAVNWEERYGELEKLNSRQAQTLGEFRKTIDDFITRPTLDAEPTPSDSTQTPISSEDWYDDPNAAVLRAVESHPAIQEARALKEEVELGKREVALGEFTTRHKDYQEIAQTPEFQNWVVDNPTRTDLFQRGNSYDFHAADALFSLYKAEAGMSQLQQSNEITQAELTSSSGELAPQEAPKYSRSEYINTLKRSKQGDLDAESWIQTNAAGYREALGSGNVRD